MSEALAYKDPGTPEEISRRTFMANATITMSGVIGLVLVIPLLGSLAPTSAGGGGTWSPLSDADMKSFQASTDKPIRISLDVKNADAYLPETENQQFVWGVKVPADKVDAFHKARPDLFNTGGGKVDYPVITMNFVMFSGICPHLGCKFNYDDNAKRFICPCHGSQFEGGTGEHVAGPAPRGLDPLPFREQSGVAQVTWIDYRASVSDRIILAYS